MHEKAPPRTLQTNPNQHETCSQLNLKIKLFGGTYQETPRSDHWTEASSCAIIEEKEIVKE